MDTKPKSTITVKRNRNGTTIRATGSYARDVLEALCGKSVEEVAREMEGKETGGEGGTAVSEHQRKGE